MPASYNLRKMAGLLLIIFGLMAVDVSSMEKIFRKNKQVPLLRSADIISSLHVPFQTDCSFGCLQEPTCVGFKYKLGVSSPSINCQLSNTNGKNNTADDDKGWVYFIDIKARLSYGSQTLPGRSCSRILAERSDRPQDGIYWITLGLSKPFPVFCVMDDIGGWTLVFKLIAGVSGRPAAFWNMPSVSFEYSLEALNEKSTFQQHYKNRLVQNWSLFNPSEVKVVLYKHGEEKVVMRFKARNSDNKNWFSEANILESPWQDMLSATKNFFTIEGPCWPNGCRDFHINHFYTHCAVDNGWLSVGNEHGCEWERRFPLGVKLIYSKIATRAQYSNYNDVDAADVFAVFLR